MVKKNIYLALLLWGGIFALQQQALAVNKAGFYVAPEKLDLIKKAWSMNTAGSGAVFPAYYSIVINDTAFRGIRPWRLRWDMIKNATDYQGKRIVELGCCMALPSTFLQKYRGASSAVAVDGTDEFLIKQGSPDRVNAAKLVAQAFDADNMFIQLDFNRDNYEQIVGYGYDIAICMSILKWIDDKDRFMRYLSLFQEVIFEGHESDEIEIERFKQYGFRSYAILGKTYNGMRTVIHFSKKPLIEKNSFTCADLNLKVPIWQLEEIDFSRFRKVKASPIGKQERIVYRDTVTDYFYKVWPANYSRVDDFLAALSAGFYNNIVSLVSLIYEGDTCRGYVTRSGVPLVDDSHGISIQEKLGRLTQSGDLAVFKFFDECDNQSNRDYRRFYNALLSTTERTGFFYFDYQPNNVVFIDGKLCFIDLEAVAPLEHLREEFFDSFYNPADYRREIKKIWNKYV